MKKLLALLLSMVMAASLAVPAFADGPDGPPPDDYDYEDAVPISAPIDGDIQWWTVEKEWDYVCEEYPERVAVFQEEVEEWYAQRAGKYAWYDAATFEEFVENAGGKEAAYLSLFYDWNWEYEREQARREFITAHGGVPGQTGVMVNGTYIKFAGNPPELANGRTMAPIQALAEALGGEAETADGKAVCETDEIRLTFTPGSGEVLVEYPGGELPGDGQMFPLDCAPYVKGGQTYVPVRFIGEALGYTVQWESAYETAVLMDPDALVDEIDRSFTILNRVLANAAIPVEEGKSYRSDIKGNVTFTAFDTLNGNTTYQAGFTGKELMNSEAANDSYSITMSDNVVDALMEQLLGTDWDEPEYEEDAAILRSILTGLDDVEVIVTREGLYWVRIPALDELADEQNVWCALPVGPDTAEIFFAGTGALTVGQLVAQSTYSASSVTVWRDAMAQADELAAVVGDGCFATSGGVSTLTMDLDTLDPDGELGLKDELSEFKLTLKVDSKGGATLSCKLQTVKGRPGMRLSVDGSLSSGQVSMSVECHISNTGELKLSLSAQRRASTEEPVTEPPEGSNIVDAPELYNR